MGGGVALFLKEDVDYCLGEDLRIDGIENIWEDAENLIIGVIYNTAYRSQRQFLDEFEQVLHTIYLSKRKCLILGDFNINTLSKSIIPKEYINLIQSEGFNPLVFEAMRITGTKISCLDRIHSNFVNSSTSGSIAAEIADHLPVFSLVYDPKCSPIPDTIEVIDFKKFDKISFQNTLRNANWLPGYNSSDANESLSRFLHIFNRINNGHAPLKIIKIKNKSNKPWVTGGLRKSIKIDNQLYKKWLTTHKSYYHDKYKLYRNKIVAINKKYCALYYGNILKESTSGSSIT